MNCNRDIRRKPARGFSLLEIVLALAILGGAMAVLGEIVRNGMENARVARDMTDAQLYCESKMAELAAGLITTDPVADAPIEPMAESVLESSATSLQSDWLYSIESELIDENGLVQVFVTVSQDPTRFKKPVSFTMSRLILDESLMLIDDTSTDEML